MPQVRWLYSDSFDWTSKPQPKETELTLRQRIHQGACWSLAENGDEMEGLTKTICTYSKGFKQINFDKLGKLHNEVG